MLLFVGIDQSLTALGLAAVRSDWGLDFRRVHHTTFGTGPGAGSNAARRASLADDVVARVQWLAEQHRVPPADVRVLLEGGIMNARDVFTIRSQERLTGVLEHELLTKLRIQLEIPEQRSIRSTFAGKSASYGRGTGEAMQALLLEVISAGTDGHPYDWREGELDAFLVANHGLSMAGEAFVSVAPPVEPEKPARRRGRKAA